MNTQSILAQNLILYRKQRGFTQTALARKARTTQQTVSDIETGKANPRFSTVTRLACALQIETALLFQPDTNSEAAQKAK